MGKHTATAFTLGAALWTVFFYALTKGDDTMTPATLDEGTRQ